MTPRLTANALGVLVWEWHGQDPYRWNVWTSPDGGLTYEHIEDWWAVGSNRDFAPDGGSQFCIVVGVDENGLEVTHRSNAIRPDDWAVGGPLMIGLEGYWDGDSATDLVAAREISNADTGIFGSAQTRPDGVTTGVFEATIESDLFYSPAAEWADDSAGRTVNAWFKMTVWQGMMLFSFMETNGDGGTSRTSLRWCPDSWFYEIFSYNGTDYDVDSFGFADEPPGYGTWVMITVTSDDTMQEVYLNGVLQSQHPKSAPTGLNAAETPDAFYLNGAHPWGNFAGQICLIGHWSRVLDGAEIVQLYNSGAGLPYGSL